MPGNTVSFKELQELFEYDDPHQVVACLNDNKIPYHKGKYGRPWTTVAAMNYALGISDTDKQPDSDKMEF
ncbi:MAG: hypothetical protein JAY88_14570 [Candidatus Thiodiazotropha lotti]|nr:hypothetical protein [Candidatus Thiodiazotropha lotti]MCW4188287.1 hypothetical protein [Candidatus Thiodiazotropha lotti]